MRGSKEAGRPGGKTAVRAYHKMTTDRYEWGKYSDMDCNILLGTLIPFAGTTLGAAMVFFLRGEMNERLQKALLGFASGVMIAASDPGHRDVRGAGRDRMGSGNSRIFTGNGIFTFAGCSDTAYLPGGRRGRGRMPLS